MAARSSARSPYERPLLSLLAALCVLPALLLGGVHPQTWVLVLALSAIAALMAALHRRRGQARPFHHPRFLSAAALLGLTLTLLQTIPLPRMALRAFSPAAAALRTLVDEPSSAQWWTLSMAPSATQLALAASLGSAILFWVAANFLNRTNRARTVMRVFFAVGVVLALVGLVQTALYSSRILGLYKPDPSVGTSFMATFVNRNHAAGFFLLVAGVGIGLARQTSSLRRRIVILFLLVLPVTALLMTRSRGALLGLAAVFAFGLLLRSASTRPHRLDQIVGVVFAVLALSVSLIYAREGIRSRLDATLGQELSRDAKIQLWRDSLKMANAFPAFGVGRGALQDVLPHYKTSPALLSYTHAENLVVQSAAEWGYPATVVLVVLVVLGLWRAVRSSRIEPLHIGAFAAVAALLVQNLFDFNLEFPGTAAPSAILLGLVASRQHSESSPLRWRTETALGAMAAVAVVVIAFSLPALKHTLSAEDSALRALTARRDLGPAAFARAEAAVAQHPADYHIHVLVGAVFLRGANAHGMRHLNEAMLLNPWDPNVHVQAARVLSGVGRRAQAALEYRAAFERGFPINDAIAREILRNCTNVGDATPSIPHALGEMAFAFDHIGRPDLAAWHYHRILEITAVGDPIRIGPLRALVNAQGARAAQEAQELARIGPQASDLLSAVVALQAAGRNEAADGALMANVDRFPRDWVVVRPAADALVRRGQAVRAERLLERAADTLSDARTRIEALDSLATVQERIGKPYDARDARHRAAALRATNP